MAEDETQAIAPIAARHREGVVGACLICGGPLRSARERDAKTCAYHLDVMTPPASHPS